MLQVAEYENFVRKRITQLRHRLHVSEHKMSLDLGKSGSYMRSISIGKAMPSMHEFLRICGFSGEEFCSLTDKQLRYYEKLFRDPELFLPTPIGIMPMKCTPDQYKRLMQERSAANRGER